ncbi:MAG: Rab family GTPase [Candidatus Asgardarchaeia archaeon]
MFRLYTSASKRKIFKILVLGDIGVGKTSLIKRFISNHFQEEEFPQGTIGVNFFTKKLTLNNVDIFLSFWDFSGAHRFRPFIPDLFKGAHGGIFVFDPTCRTSLIDIEEFWIPAVEEKLNITFKPNSRHPFVLVQNKTDVQYIYGTEITDDDISEISSKYGLKFFDISVKDNRNIVKPIEFIVKRILKNMKKETQVSIKIFSKLL